MPHSRHNILCTALHAALACAALCAAPELPGQSVSDYAVLLSASVQTDPPRITLSWPFDPSATNYVEYRKTLTATSWGAATSLAGAATSFVDSSVSVSGAYEYRISKTGWNGAASYTGNGYLYAGIQAPLIESRGKVVLIVDNTFTTSLALELARLQQDLAGDGWNVLRHDVPRMAVDPANTSSSVWAARASELASVKALIKADYNADPANVKTVFLFGHAPVPYSGNIAPDGHPEHIGAWPADVYYGDMHGVWTDDAVNTSGNASPPSDPRNVNAPGDGKFDQSLLPALAQLEVGRVDLANLPSFSKTEGELLRQYLNKDHYFRHKFITVQRRGLVDDNFGSFSGEAFAAVGGRNFAPFFGASNTFAISDWFSTLNTQSYLWGYGCGGGTFTSADGVGSTSDFVANDPRVVFTMLFGSWFGDWDSPDNFLRAGLATSTYTLCSAWAGRPYWEFHHMGLGEHIGFSARLSQNNSTLYAANVAQQWVHVALMGDPTLRMHPVAPPGDLRIISNGSGGVDLSWSLSPDPVAGYHVYRAASSAGPFTRLTSALLADGRYTDNLVSSNVYMVRAVNLELSGSGTYFNPSQGIFQSLDPAFGLPAIVLVQPANGATFLSSAGVQLNAGVFDPANSVTNVIFFTNGVELAEVAAPPYAWAWKNAPLGLYQLSVKAICASGLSATSASAAVVVDNGAAPLLGVTSLGDNVWAIGGQDVLGRTYRIQYLPDVLSTNWQDLGTATADSSGLFQLIDSNSVPQRLYRTSYP